MASDRFRPASLPAQFRKWDIDRRREALLERLAPVHEEGLEVGLGLTRALIDIADVMVESAVGYAGLPLAVCRGINVDDTSWDVPLVTEEPSVVAAVTYAAHIVSRNGGFVTSATDPITTGQVFLEAADKGAEERIGSAEAEIRRELSGVLQRMEQRGGGFRGLDVATLPSTGLLRVQIHVDVRDAMGANAVNTAAEHLKPFLESLSGGRCLMAILTNDATRRRARAEFTVPVSSLSRAGIDGPEMARRIVLAGALAAEDSSRAVTHNKGVMNGISALMLATGNDTRAVEAAVHSFAARSGSYRAISKYSSEGDALRGVLEVPLPVGTVGGAAGVHPTSRLALKLLGSPSATELARIAAAVGLAQNLAALAALTGEGIQRGHMALHQRRRELSNQ